jgi:hypothetical protein
MRLLREHLSYANVMATVAVFIALGGGAYALKNNSVRSKHIAKGQVRSSDLQDRKKPTQGVRGRDVALDTLTEEHIREETFDVGEFGSISNVGGGFCNPTSSALIECVTKEISAPKDNSEVLLLASGGHESVGGPAESFCRLYFDGRALGAIVAPGETATDNTDGTAYESFSFFDVEGGVSEGRHEIEMRCSESLGDAKINHATLVAVTLATGK